MANAISVDGSALASTGTGGNLTLKQQMDKIFSTEASNSNPLEISGMIGASEDDENAVIIRLKPLKPGGDKKTYPLRMRLKGTGIDSDGAAEGNEQRLTLYSDSILVDQKQFPVRLPGRMGLQYLSLGDLRKEALKAVKEQGGSWQAELAITMMVGKLGVNYEVLPAGFSGWAGNSLVDVDSTHLMYSGSATSKASLASTDKFTLQDLNKLRMTAKTLSPKVPPLVIGGKQFYLVLMHPRVVKDLKNSTTTLNWGDIEKAKLMGGQAIKENGLISGSLGVYNGCILYEYEQMPLFNDYGAGLNVEATGVLFLGAQAAVQATGKYAEGFDWHVEEKTFNYGQEYGCNVMTIQAVKPTIYNSKRFGMLRIDCAAAVA